MRNAALSINPHPAGVGWQDHQQWHDSFAMAGHNGHLGDSRWRLRPAINT
jgi:hypothetical protein